MQIDATVLQYQNQNLLQQIDIQKQELYDLEARVKELKDKQSSYDDILIVVNQLWNQVSLDYYVYLSQSRTMHGIPENNGAIIYYCT